MSRSERRSSGVAGVMRAIWALTAVPLFAFVLALLVGAIVIVLSSVLVLKNPFDPTLPISAYAALAQGAFGSFDSVVSTLVLTTPLLLAGLGVAIGFRAGLFNIGAQGQFLMGAVGAVAVAIHAQQFPAAIAITVSLLGGMVVGSAWGLVPGGWGAECSPPGAGSRAAGQCGLRPPSSRS